MLSMLMDLWEQEWGCYVEDGVCLQELVIVWVGSMKEKKSVGAGTVGAFDKAGFVDTICIM